MKKIILLFLFCTCLNAHARNPINAVVTMSYDPNYDAECQHLEDPWEHTPRQYELIGITNELKLAWDKFSVSLFKQLFKQTGIDTIGRKYQVALNICGLTRSELYVGDPIQVNAMYFLDTYRQKFGGPKFDGQDFTDILFHEVLHTLISDQVEKSELLRTRFVKEKNVVKNHLHLMALQKSIYKKMNRPDRVLWLDQLYTQFTSDDYQRAWEIVEENGEEIFLQEFKNSKSTTAAVH